MENKFDIRKIIHHESRLPEGELEFRGYVIHKFIQFENLVNRFIFEILKSHTKIKIYNLGWSKKEELFFEALKAARINEGSVHYKAFQDTLPSVVTLRHAMAHWTWTVAESDGEKSVIKFEKPDQSFVIVDDKVISKYQEDLGKLETRLSVICMQLIK